MAHGIGKSVRRKEDLRYKIWAAIHHAGDA